LCYHIRDEEVPQEATRSLHRPPLTRKDIARRS
jgi:hypothetical protein